MYFMDATHCFFTHDRVWQKNILMISENNSRPQMHDGYHANGLLSDQLGLESLGLRCPSTKLSTQRDRYELVASMYVV